jgi:hypothetical protein
MRRSFISGGEPISYPGAAEMRAVAFTRTRASVRSGYVAAKSSAIGAASATPMIAARSRPTASITADTSSIQSSSGGSSFDGIGSERPIPYLSNEISRLNEERRLR